MAKLQPKSVTWLYKYGMDPLEAEIKRRYYRDGKLITHSWYVRYEGKHHDYGVAGSLEEAQAALALAVREVLEKVEGKDG